MRFLSFGRSRDEPTIKVEKTKGRLSWRGSGRGFAEGADPETHFYTIQFYNRSSGFTIALDLPSATHEIYLSRHIEGKQRLLFRGQFDFRMPGRNPDTVARWVAESLIGVIRRTAIPRMLGESARPFHGKPTHASHEEITEYWGWNIETSCEALLQATLSENQIPRALYEMDREFYIQSYPP